MTDVRIRVSVKDKGNIYTHPHPDSEHFWKLSKVPEVSESYFELEKTFKGLPTIRNMFYNICRSCSQIEKVYKIEERRDHYYCDRSDAETNSTYIPTLEKEGPWNILRF